MGSLKRMVPIHAEAIEFLLKRNKLVKDRNNGKIDSIHAFMTIRCDQFGKVYKYVNTAGIYLLNDVLDTTKTKWLNGSF